MAFHPYDAVDSTPTNPTLHQRPFHFRCPVGPISQSGSKNHEDPRPVNPGLRVRQTLEGCCWRCAFAQATETLPNATVQVERPPLIGADMATDSLSCCGIGPEPDLPRLCQGDRWEPRKQAMSCKRVAGTNTWLVWLLDINGEEQTLRLSRPAALGLARIIQDAAS